MPGRLFSDKRAVHVGLRIAVQEIAAWNPANKAPAKKQNAPLAALPVHNRLRTILRDPNAEVVKCHELAKVRVYGA